MGRSVGYDCLLTRISSGICENASKHHQVDLERLSRRSDTETRFRGMLGDLKRQVAGNAALRARSACLDSVVARSPQSQLKITVAPLRHRAELCPFSRTFWYSHKPDST